MSDFASVRKRLHEQLGADAEALAELAAHQLVELDRLKERQADLERDCAEWSEAAAVMERELETMRPENADLTTRCAAATVEGARLRSLLEEAVWMLRSVRQCDVKWPPQPQRCPVCSGFHPASLCLDELLDRAGRALR